MAVAPRRSEVVEDNIKYFHKGDLKLRCYYQEGGVFSPTFNNSQCSEPSDPGFICRYELDAPQEEGSFEYGLEASPESENLMYPLTHELETKTTSLSLQQDHLPRHNNNNHYECSDSGYSDFPPLNPMPEPVYGDPADSQLSQEWNCDRTLVGIVDIQNNLNTGIDAQEEMDKWSSPIYRVVVKDPRTGSELFTSTKPSLLPPALAFHPQKSRVFSIMTYLLSHPGVSIETCDVSGSEVRCVMEKCVSSIDADGDSVSHLSYDRAGKWLVAVILERMIRSKEYLVRMFVLDSLTCGVLLRPNAALLKVCDDECIVYAKPCFSRCNSYVAVPASQEDKAYTHKLPVTLSLLNACRRQLLQQMVSSDNIDSLEIPESLKKLLLFDT